MISALADFDSVTAAGILARAALSMDGNPAGEYRIPNEADVREAIIREALEKHGFSPSDRRPEALAIVGDLLDDELDRLVAPKDPEQTLLGLSARGELPSDLFDVQVIPDIEKSYGARFPAEKKLIDATVRNPDREQHYGPHPTVPDDPFLISLFLKHFPDRYPGRSFALLVGGQRYGLTLLLHHVWRIYPSDINVHGAETLVDLLRRFADVFGVEVQFGDKRGRFILGGEVQGNDPLTQVTIPANTGERNKHGKNEIRVTCFWQHNPMTGAQHAALVTAIDMVKYRRVLKTHRGF